jgi:hypothetical protein
VLLDGRNRLDAAERAGVPVVDRRGNLVVRHEVITHHDKFDAWAFVVSANLHRRHLNAEQRRDLAAKLLKEMPGRSDRATARLAGVSPTTVGKVRHDLEAVGGVSKLDTRIDAIGRQQPATKPVADLEAAAHARWERQDEQWARIGEAQAAAAAAGEPVIADLMEIAVARSDVMVASRGSCTLTPISTRHSANSYARSITNARKLQQCQRSSASPLRAAFCAHSP